jgi:hypothetical protein
MARAWGVLLFVLACDDPARRAPAPAVSASPPDTGPPPPEGCARFGPLEGVDADPACALAGPPENAAPLQRLSVALEIDPPTVVAGATSALRLTITNNGGAEALVVFDAQTRAPGPQADWSRIAGMPAPPDTSSAAPRLVFPVTTLDDHEHNVDAPPTVPGGAPSPSAPKLVGVRVRAGGKLTQTIPWWAFRIPAAPPIVVDDAGHRYITKTVPVPLWPGDYTVNVEVPLHGVTGVERVVSGHVHVDKSPLPKPRR